MAKLSIEERIAQLEARKKSLQARLTKQDRAADTRRKVLLGAFLLDRMEDAKAAARDPDFTARLRDWLTSELPVFLTRPNDRALFPEWIAQDSVGALLALLSALLPVQGTAWTDRRVMRGPIRGMTSARMGMPVMAQ